MAKKVDAEMAKRLKALNINAKTEDAAREKLLGILEENGIEGMEDEDTDTLIDIAESFVEPESESESKSSDDDDAEDLASEVEEEDKDDETDNDDNDDEEEEEEELAPKKKVVAKNVKSAKSAKKVEPEPEPEDDDEEEDEDEKPAPKTAKKPAAKPAKKADKKVDSSKKETPAKRSTRLDPKNNPEDRKVFDVFKKLFPENQYEYAWIVSGLTIKHKGANSNRGVISVDNLSLQADGTYVGNLYFLNMGKRTEVLDAADVEYVICWSGAPLAKRITLDDMLEILENIHDDMVANLTKMDKKLGENRQKMEKELEKKNKDNAKKATAKKKVEPEPEPEDDEEDDDEEEEDEKPAPKKKVEKKPAAKSAKKGKK